MRFAAQATELSGTEIEKRARKWVLRGKWLTNHYHNFNHALNVTYNAKYISEKLGLDSTPFVLASLFHDFGHSGGTLTDKENINIAVKGLAEFFNEEAYLLKDLKFDYIERLIRCTEFPYTTDPKDIGECIMRDADRLCGFRKNHIHEVVIGFGVGERGLPLEAAFMEQKKFIQEVSFYTAPAVSVADKRKKEILKDL